jgi:hypothetical protein
MKERRSKNRKYLDVYFNKFISGFPYLCRCIDMSSGGVLVETYAEPDVDHERFQVELRLPGDDESLWLWARRTRVSGKRQALEFVTPSRAVVRRIEACLSFA